MKVYNIISRNNRLEAELTVFNSGNGMIIMKRRIKRFYRLADEIENKFPVVVQSASMNEMMEGKLWFEPLRSDVEKRMLTDLDKILDEFG